ncbi:MAG: hypothetical protein KBA46_05675 [Candidatus Omnitrophica bacterium]|nr:hypothetical protein [Candidatus Omnitrophota bacterium]
MGQQERVCRFCSKPLRRQDEVCSACGVNQATGVVVKPVANVSEKLDKKARSEAYGKHSNAGFLVFVLLILFGVYAFFNKELVGLYIAKTRLMITNLTSGKNAAKAKPGSAASAQKSTSAKKGAKGKSAEQDNTLKFSEIMRQHFEKEPLAEKKYTTFKIEGIFFDPSNKSSAIINGKLVFEQDIVAGYTIKKIQSNTVEVESGTESKILKAGESFPLPSLESIQQ